MSRRGTSRRCGPLADFLLVKEGLKRRAVPCRAGPGRDTYENQHTPLARAFVDCSLRKNLK